MILGMRFSTASLLWLPVFAICGFACQPSAGVTEQRVYGKPFLLCTISDNRIDESSGVAASLEQDGVWYTHNDSGDTSRFFRFNESGAVTGVFTLKGAHAVDWEDMASARVGGAPWLYFGDIGDNLGIRQTIVVYRVAEPTGARSSLGEYDTYTLRYPDGPHNAEALLVRPETGDLYIVTKTTAQTSAVYKLASPSASGTFTLAKIGEIKVGGGIEGSRLITGGDVSPDGKHVIVRTYLGAYEFSTAQGFPAVMPLEQIGPKVVRMFLGARP